VGSADALAEAATLEVGEMLPEGVPDALMELVPEPQGLPLLLRLREFVAERVAVLHALGVREKDGLAQALVVTVVVCDWVGLEVGEVLNVGDALGEPVLEREGVMVAEPHVVPLPPRLCDTVTDTVPVPHEDMDSVGVGAGLLELPELAEGGGEALSDPDTQDVGETLGEGVPNALTVSDTVPQSVALPLLLREFVGVCVADPQGLNVGDAEGLAQLLGPLLPDRDAEALGHAVVAGEKEVLGEPVKEELGARLPVPLLVPLLQRLALMVADTDAVWQPLGAGDAELLEQLDAAKDAVCCTVKLGVSVGLMVGDTLGDPVTSTDKVAEPVLHTVFVPLRVLLVVTDPVAVTQPLLEGDRVALMEPLPQVLPVALGEGLIEPAALGEGEMLEEGVPDAHTEAERVPLTVTLPLRLRVFVTVPLTVPHPLAVGEAEELGQRLAAIVAEVRGEGLADSVGLTVGL
jgi:hypothetical protein